MSENRDIQRDFIDLYKSVLREYQFSLSGIIDRDLTIIDFFRAMADHSFFSNEVYAFLMGGFLRLEGEEHLVDKKWEPIQFSSLFYKTYTPAIQDKLLSFYFYCLYRVSADFSTSYILSRIIVSDIDFKVSIDTKIKIPSLQFHSRQRILEVKIPVNFIQFEKTDSIEDFRRTFRDCFKEFKQPNCIAEQVPGDSYIIKNISEISEECQIHYESVFKKFLIEEKWKSYSESIIQELKQLISNNRNLFVENLQKDELNLAYFANSCLSLAFLSFYYQANIEYLLSVANIQELDNGKKLFQNLGGLIIGYDLNYNISEAERIYLNVISDRITSIVANDYLSNQVSRFDIIKGWSNNLRNNNLKSEYLGLTDSEKWKEYNKTISSRSTEILTSLLESLSSITDLVEFKKENKLHEYRDLSPKTEKLDRFLISRRVFLGLIAYKDKIAHSFDRKHRTIEFIHKAAAIILSSNNKSDRANGISQGLCITEKNPELYYEKYFFPEELAWFKRLEA